MINDLTSNQPARRRWMVVDDDDGVRAFMVTLLEMITGVEVVSCASADEALPAFADAPQDYQVIVTDLEMPGLNGAEFCRRVRELSPDMKVLLVTGLDAMNETEAHRLGFCGLLLKPFQPTALWRALAAVAA